MNVVRFLSLYFPLPSHEWHYKLNKRAPNTCSELVFPNNWWRSLLAGLLVCSNRLGSTQFPFCDNKLLRCRGFVDALNVGFWLLHWCGGPYHTSKGRIARPMARSSCPEVVHFCAAVWHYLSSIPVATQMPLFQISPAFPYSKPALLDTQELKLDHYQWRAATYIRWSVPWIFWGGPLNHFSERELYIFGLSIQSVRYDKIMEEFISAGSKLLNPVRQLSHQIRSSHCGFAFFHIKNQSQRFTQFFHIPSILVVLILPLHTGFLTTTSSIAWAFAGRTSVFFATARILIIRTRIVTVRFLSPTVSAVCVLIS